MRPSTKSDQIYPKLIGNYTCNQTIIILSSADISDLFLLDICTVVLILHSPIQYDALSPVSQQYISEQYICVPQYNIFID